jgi:hypothetical protein
MNRRKLFQTTAVGLLLLFAIAVQAADWPQFRGPNRDGVWNETGIMESFPSDGLKILWRAPVGWGWSSPVVARGRVFLTDAQVQKPSVKERVHCFDATTGKPLWTYVYDVTYPDWVLYRARPAARPRRLLSKPARFSHSAPTVTFTVWTLGPAQ